MRASVIVPVWNGGSVVGACLDAVYARSGARLAEVVCVDNASDDDSAAVITARHPRARLLAQPVNLGFAGGVNAGADAARGDVLVLLNQDTLVEPGWLDALLDGVRADDGKGFGIAGATIVAADGALDHAGAFVRRPDAEGIHVTTPPTEDTPRAVDYVTGAVMAITRRTWNAVGRFDEGYYPAYYEDCDYCYRATGRGIRTAHVPAARVVHLRDGSRHPRDPIRVAADHHFVRYRFVAKHWNAAELAEFFAAEETTLAADVDFPRVVGRVLAARALGRRLDDVLASRARDLDPVPSPGRRTRLQHGFAALVRAAITAAERVASADGATPSRAVVEPEAAVPGWKQRVRRRLLRKLGAVAGDEHARLEERVADAESRIATLEATDAAVRVLRVLAEYDR
jgi:GT2 family glycosyltransferase